MEFQNERERTGDWLALEYDFPNGRDRIAAGWAHAGASVGDPGGQHNYMPAGVGDNQANMTTLAYWHKFDKQFSMYADVADTANDGNAHYDIGAGGHGIKTDCHDATHALFIDYSSAGPTTWGGCHRDRRVDRCPVQVLKVADESIRTAGQLGSSQVCPGRFAPGGGAGGSRSGGPAAVRACTADLGSRRHEHDAPGRSGRYGDPAGGCRPRGEGREGAAG